jgi:hypothetical protein
MALTLPVRPERVVLVHALIDAGVSLDDLAVELDLNRQYLGGVVFGSISPGPKARRRIAARLGDDEARLFPDEAVSA